MTHRPMKRMRASLPILAAAATLAGCTVGPNYAGAPNVAPVASAASTFQRANAAPVDAATPPARWWDTMGDPMLARLIDDAFAASPTLKQAQARILEARAMLAQQRANLAPNGTVSGSYTAARLPLGDTSKVENEINSAIDRAANVAQQSGVTVPTSDVSIPDHLDLDLYSVGFDALWEVDLFGGRRRGVEAARARTEAAAAQNEDSQVQLAAEVGQAYVNLRGAQHRRELLRRSGAVEQRMLDLTLAKRRYGTASDVDIARQQAQIKQTEAMLPSLDAQIDQSLDQLAVLTGKEPGMLDATLSPARPLPLPPQTVAVGDPAAMLRRRPDIRAAERQLAASNAGISQAVAQYFPRLTLVGSLGFSANDPGDLLQGSSLSVLGLPMLSWNFLDFGRTASQVRQARARFQESLASYRNTVLQALQDAEDSLSRYGHQREAAVKTREALAATVKSAQLAEVRHRGGTATALDALDAERQRLQTEQSLAQAETELSNDYISLQKSLGLGWQPVDWRQIPVPKEP